MQHIIDKDIDIACFTESWLMGSDNHITFRIKSYGYLISHKHRKTGTGGGVCVIYKPSIIIKTIQLKMVYQSFEYLCVTVSSHSKSVNDLAIACIYRKQEVNFKQFQIDFLNFCEKVIETSHLYFLVVGDFNVHYELPNSMSNDLRNITTSFGLSQHVQTATHKKGHTLDLIFSNIYEIPVKSVNVDSTVTEGSVFKFDHFPITFSVKFNAKNISDFYKEIIVRNVKSLDFNAFNDACCESLSTNMDIVHNDNFNSTVAVFNDCLRNTLDEFSPCRVKRVYKNAKHLPIKWVDDEYKIARNERRKLERAWNKHRNDTNKQRYLNQKNVCANMAKQKISTSLSRLINDRENVSNLFKLLYTILDKDNSIVFPESDNNTSLANDFNNFYLTKIENIRDTIPYCTETLVFNSTDLPIFNEFSCITVDDLRDIFKEMGKIKTSPCDPLPAKFLVNCVESLLLHFVTIINKSLSDGNIEGLKNSVIMPKYKGNDTDANSFNSYRPIFNLPFMGKLIEKVVLKQFTEHIRDSCYNSPYQHGYKKFHSTETMLLELYDEVLLGFDNKYCTVLVMIDMSAAFDTVDLDILLNILYSVLNIRGTAFSWFRSFLKNRSQCVKINECFSETTVSEYGVPAGSTLGPILFNVYTKGLSDVIINSGFKTSSYADDSNGRLQFMINMQYSSLCVDIPVLLDNVQEYMNKYFLKMNPHKTEIMLISPPPLSKKVISGIFIDSSCIRFSSENKFLGVFIDSSFNFNYHINNIISSCHLKLKGIRRIRHLMNCKDTETYVHAVILSKINYCNILFMSLSSENLYKLQKLQNSAVRLIFNLPPRSSVSEKYHELKLLRVDQCIVFKCLVFVHKFFRNEVPLCIKQLLNIQHATERILTVKYYTSTYARKSFSYCAPRYWNKLPHSTRLTDSTSKFKGQLKRILLENENNIMSATTGYYFIPR